MRTVKQSLTVAVLLGLGACARTTIPAVHVETVEVVREVQRPCAATAPVRPAPLDRPLPADPVKLAALLGAKLGEWAGAGGYGERAEAALKACAGGL